MFFVYGLTFVVALLFGLLIIPTIKFWNEKRQEETLWNDYKPQKIHDPGTVRNLSILPLIDYYPNQDCLEGEPGVAYLITADDKKILFDVGFNKNQEHPSPLLKNMNRIGVTVHDIDFIYISHLHRDHIGGTKNERKRTFSLSSQDVDLKGKRAYTPTKMNHPTAKIEAVNGPLKIAEGIVSIGPIHRSLWLTELTAEQALAINVEGKGIVLIVGCGHQKIERIIKRAEDLFDIPIYGIIGGLHYPVTVSRMKFNIQRMFGTGKLPWQRITKSEVETSLASLIKKNLSIIGLSPHDSCDWTLNLFKKALGSKYQDIKVGKKINL